MAATTPTNHSTENLPSFDNRRMPIHLSLRKKVKAMSTTLTPRRTRRTRVVAAAAVITIAGVGAVSVAQALRSSTTDETFTLDPGALMLDVDVDRGQVLLTAGTGDRRRYREDALS